MASLAKTSQSKNWMFTLNNYSDETSPQAWPCVKYLCYQAEKAATGTPHLQGYVMFTKNMRLAALCKIQQAHWEPRLGTHDQAVKYCTKEDTRISGPWIIGSPPEQGKRTDIESVKHLIDDGATLTQIFDEHPGMLFRYYSNIHKCMQLKIKDRTDKPLVVYHYGPPGVGKSTAVRAWCEGKSVYRKEPNNNWWDGYENQDIVILDEFCGGIPYSSLKLRLDLDPNQVEVKGAVLKFTSKEIHIISNQRPEECYADSYDYRAFHRRIDFMLHYTALGERHKVFDHDKDEFHCEMPSCPVRELLQYLHPELDYEEPELIQGVPRKKHIIPSPDRVITLSQEEQFTRNSTIYSSRPNPASYKHPRTK